MTAGSPRGRRRFGVAAVSAVVVLAVVAALIAVLGTRPAASEQLADSPLVGKAAPALSGTALGSNRKVRLAAYRHDWVLVNFFASWCTVCQEEEPQLERFAYSRPDGVRPVVIGVLYGDTASDGLRFLRSAGATFAAVDDPGGQIASAWGVGSLPHSYLVAPGGRIVACVLGGLSVSALDQLLEHERHRLEAAS